MNTSREMHTPIPLPVLVSLTDAGQALFSVMFDLERARKIELKTRLTAELTRLDLLGTHEHYADHESYVPEGSEL